MSCQPGVVLETQVSKLPNRLLPWSLLAAQLLYLSHHRRRILMMQDFLQVSLWDEGISALVQFEYDKRSVPLDILDLKNCANENAVRIGDILETLFLMAINGDWIYTSEQGEEQVLDEDALNALYAKGRLTDADLSAFAGVWRPR